jgi:predicted metal-dependent phosphoesterase TrpH
MAPTGSAARRDSFGRLVGLLLPALLLLPELAAAGELAVNAEQRRIRFPDVGPAPTLVCDLHTHTVFSDGKVWPDVRVQEAERDGLDCIAITDHLEYLPHRGDLQPRDRNRSFAVADQAAAGSDLIVINGCEITREMPLGHANAIFLQDANLLLEADPQAVFQEAKRQGAFITWNHPYWLVQTKDGIARVDPLHDEMLSSGLFNGIEVASQVGYSDEALQIALDHDLAIIATSDAHSLVDWDFDVPAGGHRPVTLVFAAEHSQQALEDALFAGRTVAWIGNTLIGREAQLLPLIQASLIVGDARYLGDTSVLRVRLENGSDAEWVLRNESAFRFYNASDLVVVPANSSFDLEVTTGELRPRIDLRFEVMNAVIAPSTHPSLTLPVDTGAAVGVTRD